MCQKMGALDIACTGMATSGNSPYDVEVVINVVYSLLYNLPTNRRVAAQQLAKWLVSPWRHTE